MWDKVRQSFLGLVLVGALGGSTGCAAEIDDDPLPTTEDEVQVSVAEKLAGVYTDGEGALSELTLSRTKVAGRYAYDFTGKQRSACVRAPCPVVTIKGKWFANKTVLSLTPTRGQRLEYRYKLSATALSLRDKQGNELANLHKKPAANSAIAKVLADFKISDARVEISEADIKKQEALGGQVKFEAAFRAGMKSFLTDGDGGGPLAFVWELDAEQLPEGCNALTRANTGGP